MKRTAVAVLVAAMAANPATWSAPPRFEKLSDHVYRYQSKPDGLNTGAVVTEEGILVVNPPGEPELKGVMDALKRISTSPVRWVVCTDYLIALAGGPARLAEEGAVIIGSDAQRPLLAAQAAAPRLSMAFGRQIHLFPGGLEVRIFGLQHKARTSGDVAVLVPAEKVLLVGELFNSGAYPEIDQAEGGGSATGWIQGAKQVIEAVPLLKPAIPAPRKATPVAAAAKGAPAAEKEKTLEEEITVVTGHGPRSNLMEFKAVLEMSQKLRAETSKLAAGGVARESLLSLPALGPFRMYSGFDAYALLLFDELSKK